MTGTLVAGWMGLGEVTGFSLSQRVQTVVWVRVMVLVPVTGVVQVEEPEVTVESVTRIC